jgi:(1->4)-alpha-D-glucan 1-alpha-D-glucosylmutase
MASTVASDPKLAEPLEVIAAAITDPESAARLQQLCGAMTAKSVEDCHFYRDARLVSLNEVGGDPHRFGVSAAEFHRSQAVRAQFWPQSMTTLSTHDTKRGEDVRARIGVLSQVPGLWSELVARWEAATPSPDPRTALFLLQNVLGVCPADGVGDEG